MGLVKALGLLGIFVSSVSFATGVMPNAANTCIGCHGPQGISASPLWPNLAGQKEAYLMKQLTDFRSGARKDPLMNPLAAALSDQDIAALAKYFSELN